MDKKKKYLDNRQYVTVTKNSLVMKDKRDKSTIDILEAKKKNIGRPPKLGRAMSSAERKAASRERMRLIITTASPETWGVKECCEAMSNDKYAIYQKDAWIRYGEIKNLL